MSLRPRSRRALARAAYEADRVLLERRLRELGLPPAQAVEVHENRTVLVSLTARAALRLHRGYAYAGDAVLRAVLAFVADGTAAPERRRAEDTVVGFPVERFVPTGPRRAGERGSDRPLVRRLREEHAQLNAEHFDGALRDLAIRLSGRMRRCLGEVRVDDTGPATEIVMSRRHVQRDPWHEVRHTLLHEMVHQWQVEGGMPLDHGASFRRKAREVGIAPRAERDVRLSSPGA